MVTPGFLLRAPEPVGANSSPSLLLPLPSALLSQQPMPGDPLLGTLSPAGGRPRAPTKLAHLRETEGCVVEQLGVSVYLCYVSIFVSVFICIYACIFLCVSFQICVCCVHCTVTGGSARVHACVCVVRTDVDVRLHMSMCATVLCICVPVCICL